MNTFTEGTTWHLNNLKPLFILWHKHIDIDTLTWQTVQSLNLKPLRIMHSFAICVKCILGSLGICVALEVALNEYCEAVLWYFHDRNKNNQIKMNPHKSVHGVYTSFSWVFSVNIIFIFSYIDCRLEGLAIFKASFSKICCLDGSVLPVWS